MLNIARGCSCTTRWRPLASPSFTRPQVTVAASDTLQVRVKHGLHEADMPEPEALRAKLHGFDFSEFPILTPAILRQLNNVVDVDVHKVYT